jgi:deoxyribodipyrimidine photolyase
MTNALIIFRCDLSIIDNLCIYDAIQHKHNNILFLILINPEQFYLNNKNKNYFSQKARDFFALATINLNNEIYTITNKKNNLILLIEENKFTLINFCKKYSIHSVYWNKLFSIYSINRDNTNKKILEDNNIKFNEWEIHIPTYGKSHPLLAFRPHKLTDLNNEQ